MVTTQRDPAQQRQSSSSGGGGGGAVAFFPLLVVSGTGGQEEERPQKNPRKDNTGFSYVEGMDFASTNEEIEAMGGDPFFLQPVTTTTSTTTTTNAINNDPLSPLVVAVSDVDSGDGKEQPFVWDGVEIEDAYFDE
jgi:hypothetical protein